MTWFQCVAVVEDANSDEATSEVESLFRLENVVSCIAVNCEKGPNGKPFSGVMLTMDGSGGGVVFTESYDVDGFYRNVIMGGDK